jgi:hypothetical protein
MLRATRLSLAVVLALLLLPAVAAGAGQAGQPADETRLDAVDIITPEPLALSLLAGHGDVEVFYRLERPLPKLPEVTVSSAGPLRAPQLRIEGAGRDAGRAVHSFRLVVEAATPLKVGDTFKGALLFESDGKVDTFPFTVTETAPATFTLDPAKYDVCVGCRDPLVFAIRVTNTGSTGISRLKVSSLTLEDASNHHRIVYPAEREADEAGGHPPAAGSVTATPGRVAPRPTASVAGRSSAEGTAGSRPGPRADVLALRPGDDSEVAIAPGDSLTIHLHLTLPARAGTYAGSAQVSANGGEARPVQLTVRTRGPNGCWALLLFILAVLAGAGAARVLEHYYGSGGGLARARALLSLDASRAMLGDLARWFGDLPADLQAALPNLRRALEDDIADTEDLLHTAGDRKPADLAALADSITGRVSQRRVLKAAVGHAHGDAGLAAKLDGVTPVKDLDAYRAALYEKLGVSALETAGSRLRRLRVPSPTAEARWTVRTLPAFRAAVWMIVVVATAYTMFYANRCSFGTLVDYITVFFWGLGLTQAGFAVLGEARSSYTPPAAAGG